jgi:hypothetical protein
MCIWKVVLPQRDQLLAEELENVQYLEGLSSGVDIAFEHLVLSEFSDSDCLRSLLASPVFGSALVFR